MTKERPVRLKTWAEVKSLDDCVGEGEARVIKWVLSRISPQNLCPFLQREGEVFYYCGVLVPPEKRDDDELSPLNPKFLGRVNYAELQLWCAGGRERYEKCIYYQNHQRIREVAAET